MASTRSFIDEKMLLVASTPIRWSKEAPIKINTFAWRLTLDRLPTRVVLDRRDIDLPSLLCLICEDVMESSSLLFFIIVLFRLTLYFKFVIVGVF